MPKDSTPTPESPRFRVDMDQQPKDGQIGHVGSSHGIDKRPSSKVMEQEFHSEHDGRNVGVGNHPSLKEKDEESQDEHDGSDVGMENHTLLKEKEKRAHTKHTGGKNAGKTQRIPSMTTHWAPTTSTEPSITASSEQPLIRKRKSAPDHERVSREELLQSWKQFCQTVKRTFASETTH